MFFLPNSSLPCGRLHTCGISLHSPATLFSEMDKKQDFTNQQTALYTYAFGENKTNLREIILDMLNH
jgi:hypothetical protein